MRRIEELLMDAGPVGIIALGLALQLLSLTLEWL
jgi:hypothetical protein